MIDRIGGDFLQWLRGFYYVATLGNISAAAEKMDLRQPTVSHQIQMLETQLGVQLFQRTPRKMILTREGAALLERALKIFEQIQGIQGEVGRSAETGLVGEISIVATHSVAANYLPGMMLSFQKEHPGTFFAVTGCTETGTIIATVVGSGVDIGIALGQSFPHSVEARPLFTSPLALIVGKEAAAANNWSFTRDDNGNLADLRELNNIPYVDFARDASMTQYVHSVLALNKVSVTVTARVNTSILLSRYVAMGFGVSFIDAFTAEAQPEVFDIYPLADTASLRVYTLVHRTKTYISPQAQAFMEYLRAHQPGVQGAVIV